MTENKQFTFDRDTVAPNIKTPIVFKEGERLSIGEVLDKLNELSDKNEQLKKENSELKSDNDIKFWKLQFMTEYNSAQLMMHELSRAIDAGYNISDDFQEYLGGVKEQNKKNIEKAERLGI